MDDSGPENSPSSEKANQQAFEKAEKKRGQTEAQTAIASLQQRWPEMFPANPFRVKPLAISIANVLAAEMDWSFPYALAVSRTWKGRSAYCKAILNYATRFNLDGSLAEPIDEQARSYARHRLESRGKLPPVKPRPKAQIFQDRPPLQAPPGEAVKIEAEPVPVVASVIPLEPEPMAPVRPLSAAEEKEKLFRAKMAQLAKKRRR